MFVKVYTYHVLPGKEADLIEVLVNAEKIYSRFVKKQSSILKSNGDRTKWMEIHTYTDENSYIESMNLINQQPEIKKLYTRFSELIQSKTELTEEDFQQQALTEHC
jgi:hypothetical protein